jgi:hypothetical protein
MLAPMQYINGEMSPRTVKQCDDDYYYCYFIPYYIREEGPYVSKSSKLETN